MRSIIAALLASTAIAAAAPASALDAGFSLGIATMNSASGGAVSGGGVNGGGSALAGVTASQTTQTAATTGLAGTKLTLGVSGPSIVSEHNVVGAAQQTTTGFSLGLAGSGGVGASNFSGGAASSGHWAGISGFLGF